MDSAVGGAYGPTVCKRLVGVLVTCPRCDHQSGRLIKVRRRILKKTEYLLHCRHCHKHPQISFEQQAVRMVAAVAPAHVDQLFPAA
jgi:transcription elongation factor Elf1